VDTKGKIKKVAVVDYCITASWFLQFIDNLIEIEDYTPRPQDIIPWQSDNEIPNSVYEGIAKFYYKGIEFHLFLDNRFVNNVDIDWDVYHMIYTIEHKFLLKGLNQGSFLKHEEPSHLKFFYEKFGKRYNRLVFNMEEPIPTDNGDLDVYFYNNLRAKIVSTYSDDNLVKLDRDKFIYVPLINFVKFFYDKGYNYLNFDVSINKENLIGAYWISNYKEMRDNLIKNVNNLLNERNQPNTKIYKQSFPRTVSQQYLEYTKEQWQTNHSTTYLDFGTSVINIVFETAFAYEDFYTEKTLKALLFSKSSYNILYKTLKHLRYLKSLGFWFLNFEYIDWSMDDINHANCEHMVNQSIYSAVNHVVDLYEELGDYNLVMQRLDEQHYEKRIKNYELVQQYIINPKYRDELLDFLFDEIIYTEKSKMI
jgi:hypothetical protein